ncbi:hypothetical protein NMY22_g12917 [Coprinellus aureogranulatus]|nr:hypothetical protein NMY22_g12917 [Coprinellus aureogranulatus]
MRDRGEVNKRNIIKQRIVEAEEDILSFKRSYNALSPPNMLPVEILSEIFMVHRARATEEFDSQDRRSCSWMRVTHVCYYWRCIATACAELWSNLLFVTPELTQFMLALSKNTPLSLKLRCMSSQVTETLCDILFTQIHRLRSVEVRGILDPPVLAKLTSEIPALEELILQPDVNYRDPQDLPCDFLDKSAPLLKHLRLLDLVMPDYDMLAWFPSLTHLYLGYPSSQNLPRPTGQSLLNALRATQSAGSPLQKMELQDVVHPVCGLLNSIRIPDETTLDFRFLNSFENLQHLHQFLATVAIAWKGGSRMSVRSLLLQDFTLLSSEYVAFEFTFYRPPQPNHRSKDDEFDFRVSSLREPGHISLAPLLSSFTERLWNYTLPWGMCLYTNPFCSIDQWITLSGALRQLLLIVLHATPADAVDAFLQALGARNRTSCPTFPSFAAIQLSWVEADDPTRNMGITHSLAEALKSRPKSHRIRRLVIGNCSTTFSSEKLAFLRTEVPDLIVEELEQQ